METSTLIQYWHPTKGGWHVGEEIGRTAVIVTVKPAGTGRKLQVPVSDVKPVEGRAA